MTLRASHLQWHWRPALPSAEVSCSYLLANVTSDFHARARDLGDATMSDLYSQAGDQWIGMALQQRHLGTTEQALQAYDGAFKRFAETAHSVPLHQEMRKGYTDLSECPPVDTTVATKLKAQRAFSAGMSVYSWHAQTFLLPADFLQFERTYKARRSPCPARHRRRAPPRCTP